MLRKIGRVVKLSLGGAVWGCLVGIGVGAVLGVLYGAWNGDVTLGLDGALLGCLCFAVAGGIYGGILEVVGGWRPTAEEVDAPFSAATRPASPPSQRHLNMPRGRT
jgi:hypothetical protein